MRGEVFSHSRLSYQDPDHTRSIQASLVYWRQHQLYNSTFSRYRRYLPFQRHDIAKTACSVLPKPVC